LENKPKHKNGLSCPSCNEFLKDTNPILARWFKEVIKPEFHDVHISCSWRGKEEQDLAFRTGASSVQFPNSKHNYINGDGKDAHALDLFFQRDGKYIASFELMKEVNDHSNMMGWIIKWGGNFPKVDAVHFELHKQLPTRRA
jgi:hypothetical protein